MPLCDCSILTLCSLLVFTNPRTETTVNFCTQLKQKPAAVKAMIESYEHGTGEVKKV